MAKTAGFTDMPDLKQGKYRHYKGGEYEVIEVACHSETLEWYVIYRRLYTSDAPEIWIRPYAMFVETITIKGKRMPRFTYLGT